MTWTSTTLLQMSSRGRAVARHRATSYRSGIGSGGRAHGILRVQPEEWVSSEQLRSATAVRRADPSGNVGSTGDHPVTRLRCRASVGGVDWAARGGDRVRLPRLGQLAPEVPVPTAPGAPGLLHYSGLVADTAVGAVGPALRTLRPVPAGEQRALAVAGLQDRWGAPADRDPRDRPGGTGDVEPGSGTGSRGTAHRTRRRPGRARHAAGEEGRPTDGD